MQTEAVNDPTVSLVRSRYAEFLENRRRRYGRSSVRIAVVEEARSDAFAKLRRIPEIADVCAETLTFGGAMNYSHFRFILRSPRRDLVALAHVVRDFLRTCRNRA